MRAALRFMFLDEFDPQLNQLYADPEQRAIKDPSVVPEQLLVHKELVMFANSNISYQRLFPQ